MASSTSLGGGGGQTEATDVVLDSPGQDESDDAPTPPATAKPPSPKKSAIGDSIPTATSSSLPPSTSTGSIFRPSVTSAASTLATAQSALGKGHPQTFHRTASLSARASAPPLSPSVSPSRARPLTRAPDPRRTSVRLPSMAGSVTGADGRGDNVTETESTFSEDGDYYYDDEGAILSEAEQMGEEGLGQRRGRPKTFLRIDTAERGATPGSIQSAAPRTGTIAPAGTAKDGSKKSSNDSKSKGKGKAARPIRPSLSRSRSRAPRHSDSDSEGGRYYSHQGNDPAPMLGGAAATGHDIEDDEVERVDRGEELVRRRIKERHRLKKEAEKKKKAAEDQSKVKQQQTVQGSATSPVGVGPSPRPQPGPARLKSMSAVPSPQIPEGRARLAAPSETGDSSASGSWEPPPPHLSGSLPQGRSPTDRQSPMTRGLSNFDRRLSSAYTDDGADDGVETPGVHGREKRSDTLRSDYTGFFSDDGEDVGGSTTGADTPTAGSPQAETRPKTTPKPFALSLPRSNSDMASSAGATPKSPIMASRRNTTRGQRSVSYASTTKHGPEGSFSPEVDHGVLTEEPEREEAEETAEEKAQEDETEVEGRAEHALEGVDEEDTASDDSPEDDVEYTLKDRQDVRDSRTCSR